PGAPATDDLLAGQPRAGAPEQVARLDEPGRGDAVGANLPGDAGLAGHRDRGPGPAGLEPPRPGVRPYGPDTPGKAPRGRTGPCRPPDVAAPGAGRHSGRDGVIPQDSATHRDHGLE